MKLYYMPGACPLASHIVLEWTGQPYETQRVPREELKQPSFLALNPLGAVPVLVDGDMTLTQSSAILEYLAELHPEADLIGRDPRARAETRRWLGLCNADLHRTFAILFGLAGYSSDETAQREIASKTAEKLVSLFAVVDQQLEGKQWVTGTRSIVDPYLYTLIRWAKAKNVGIDDMAHLQAFHGHMQKDPGVQAALAAQGLS
jgi:glutathione S-transferase